MRAVRRDFKFKGMRKPQSFIFYPCLPTDKSVFIQSNQRIGRVDLETKKVYLSKGRTGGSYVPDLCIARGAKYIDLTEFDLESIRDAMGISSVITTASGLSSTDRTITVVG